MRKTFPISGPARPEAADVIPGRPRFLCSILVLGMALILILAMSLLTSSASTVNDRETVSALDKEYQAAVKRNDAVTMARILADNFVLVTGSGKTYSKADMLEDAKRGDTYEHNDEEVQTVRVWGDTAVVTAKLWEKFTSEGKSYDHKFWFSDTYIRTPAGWKYAFGQSSLPLASSQSQNAITAVASENGRQGAIEGLVRDIACPIQNPQATATHLNVKCLLDCVRSGSPLVILTEDGDLYIPISNNMPDTDQRKELMPFVGKYVRATGTTFQRNGARAIVISEIKEMKDVHLTIDEQ